MTTKTNNILDGETFSVETIDGNTFECEIETFNSVSPNPLADNPDDFRGYTEIEYNIVKCQIFYEDGSLAYSGSCDIDGLSQEEQEEIETELVSKCFQFIERWNDTW